MLYRSVIQHVATRAVAYHRPSIIATNRGDEVRLRTRRRGRGLERDITDDNDSAKVSCRGGRGKVEPPLLWPFPTLSSSIIYPNYYCPTIANLLLQCLHNLLKCRATETAIHHKKQYTSMYYLHSNFTTIGELHLQGRI